MVKLIMIVQLGGDSCRIANNFKLLYINYVGLKSGESMRLKVFSKSPVVCTSILLLQSTPSSLNISYWLQQRKNALLIQIGVEIGLITVLDAILTSRQTGLK